MGLLSDFFIASRSDVDAMDINDGPMDKFPCLQAKTVEPVKICMLRSIIDGSTFDELLPTIGDMIIREQSEDGLWIVAIPDVITEKLATASPEELIEISNKWALTEEWQRDGATPENMAPFVSELAKLAKDVRLGNQQTYLWISL